MPAESEPGPRFVPEEHRGDEPFDQHDSYEECVEAGTFDDPADGVVHHADRPLVGKAARCTVCYRQRVRFYDDAGELREVEYSHFDGDTEAVEQVD